MAILNWGRKWGREAECIILQLCQWLVAEREGFRTPGTLARTPHFECGAIDHSATSPEMTAKDETFPQGRRAD